MTIVSWFSDLFVTSSSQSFTYEVIPIDCIATPVIAWLSEKHQARQAPLLWGLLALVGFVIIFMEAPNYPVMVLARFVQGISSSVVWVVGLALL